MRSSAFSYTNSIAALICAMVSPGGRGVERLKPSIGGATVSVAFTAQVYNAAGPNGTRRFVNPEGRKSRDGPLRYCEESRIDFKPDTRVPNRYGCGYRGPTTHERIEDDAASQGEGRSDNLTHECLWLQ